MDKLASVVIVDSVDNKYVTSPDIEDSVLKEVATVELLHIDQTQELIESVADANVIISWHLVPIQTDVLNSLKNCRGIVRAAVGFDNIDIQYAGELGIPVYNIPDYGTEEVANHTMALLLSLNRKLSTVDDHVRQGGWEWRTVGKVDRLRNKVLGIVGFGRIGIAVAKRAQMFGLDVIFYDPYVVSGTDKAHGVKRTENLHDLIRRSDIISIHAPLTDETYHMFSEKEFSLMGPSKTLINTARGQIIKESAMLSAVGQNLIGALGLDVLEFEPDVPSELKADNIILTAHSAFYSDAGVKELREKTANSALQLLKGNYGLREIINDKYMKKTNSSNEKALLSSAIFNGL